MKASKIIFAFAAAALLASCRTQLTPEEESSYRASQSAGSTTSSQPATTSSQQPSTTSSEPTTTSSEPATTSSEPATTSSEPATTSSEPATTSSEEPSSQSSTEESSVSSSSEEETTYLYFRESVWWNAETVKTYIALDDVGLTGIDPNFTVDFDKMLAMEYVSTVRQSATGWFSYWKIDAALLGEASNVRFVRGGPHYENDEPTELIEFWGAVTESVALSSFGDNNMYDLLEVEKPAAWEEGASEEASRVVEGLLSIYNPGADVPYVPSSEDSSQGGEGSSSTPSGSYYGPEGSELVSWYIAGSGKLFSGWSLEGGVQLFSNPGNLEDKGCVLNMEFAVDDTFKVTDGQTWYGYEKCDPYEGEANAGKSCFTGVSDGYGGSNWKCTVAGFYDVYVNGSGVFWIQVHA